jgi:transposase
LRYYPQILELCSFPDEPWSWSLLETAPTPDRGGKLSLARIRRLLATHRIRRVTAERVHEVLGQQPPQVAPGVVEAVSERVLLMLPQLRLLHRQRKDLAERIDRLLKSMASLADTQAPDYTVGRDIAIMTSIPGLGRVVAAALVAEACEAIRLRDHYALRAHGGTAPVTRQSGKTRQVIMRYSCNNRLRNALYHWARISVQKDARSKQHYARLRKSGHCHGRALRGVADRLLAALVAMLKSGRAYDPARRGGTAPSSAAA